MVPAPPSPTTWDSVALRKTGLHPAKGDSVRSELRFVSQGSASQWDCAPPSKNWTPLRFAKGDYVYLGWNIKNPLFFAFDLT